MTKQELCDELESIEVELANLTLAIKSIKTTLEKQNEKNRTQSTSIFQTESHQSTLNNAKD